MNFQDFKKHIRAERLACKGTWYCYQGTVEGLDVKLKGYGTWLQVFDVDGVSYAGGCDSSVKEHNAILAAAFATDYKIQVIDGLTGETGDVTDRGSVALFNFTRAYKQAAILNDTHGGLAYPFEYKVVKA